MTDLTQNLAKQDDKFALQLTMIDNNNAAADHYKNATNIIPFLANALTQDGINHDIDFSLFAANYISGITAFIVTMPNCYAAVLKRKEFIIVRTETAAYKLVPKEEPYIAREKKVDTGHNWASCNGQAGTTDKFETVKMSLTALFGKHDMRVVECKEIFDKESGAGKNQYRVAFELIDSFNKLGLYKIKNSTLTSGAGVSINFSSLFNKHHGLHQGCLKTTDNRAPVSARCSCGETKAGPSATLANRAAAQSSFKERALKRARELSQDDPFA